MFYESEKNELFCLYSSLTNAAPLKLTPKNQNLTNLDECEIVEAATIALALISTPKRLIVILIENNSNK